jgi:hypothetical protein
MILGVVLKLSVIQSFRKLHLLLIGFFRKRFTGRVSRGVRIDKSNDADPDHTRSYK